ncbi:MAG: DUF1667 domain-containing protein [Clostridia bacterium]|nr:DUF1667 domain-containing protein [Clostridia bacterium]
MDQTITCINCPVGCRLKAAVDGGKVTAVSGQGCKRGVTYARQECLAPTRMVTGLVALKGCRMPLSVKTERPVPKDRIFPCMAEINRAKPQPPIVMGQVICENVCGTGVNVIATKSVSPKR